MSTVKDALAQKSGALIHVRSGDMVVEALRQMRDNRVRSVLVIDDDVLVGIVTQGDCAIKVLLPGLDAKQNSGGPSDDGRPGDGQAGRPTGRLHGNDGCARLSPSTSAGRGQGRGRDLDWRRRQGHHPKFGAQSWRPDGLHHDGRPRGLTDEPRGAVMALLPMSVPDHSRPSHSAPMRINVCCCSKSDQIADKREGRKGPFSEVARY